MTTAFWVAVALLAVSAVAINVVELTGVWQRLRTWVRVTLTTVFTIALVASLVLVYFVPTP